MHIKITLPNLGEEVTSFDDLLQWYDKTIVYFYPKDDTPWCTIQANDFSANIQAFRDLWVQVVWISKDDHTSHCSFIKKHGLHIPLITDTDLTLHNKFGTRWEKNMYGKKVMATIRSTFLLDKNWNILQERKNVKADGHVEKVLAYLSKT